MAVRAAPPLLYETTRPTATTIRPVAEGFTTDFDRTTLPASLLQNVQDVLVFVLRVQLHHQRLQLLERLHRHLVQHLQPIPLRPKTQMSPITPRLCWPKTLMLY